MEVPRNGRPAKYMCGKKTARRSQQLSLYEATKFGSRPLLKCRAVTLNSHYIYVLKYSRHPICDH